MHHAKCRQTVQNSMCYSHHVYVEFLHSGEIVFCISFVCAWGWVASCAVKVTAHHWVNHILQLSSFMVKTHRTQWEAKFTLILFCMGAYERLKWYDIKCQPKSLHPLVFMLNVLLLFRVLFQTISVYCTKSLPAILKVYTSGKKQAIHSSKQLVSEPIAFLLYWICRSGLKI